MSQREFAMYLGVSERTVAKWDSRGAGITPRSEFQRMLDTALANAPADAETRFRALQADRVAAQLNEDDAAEPPGASPSASPAMPPFQMPVAPETTSGPDIAELYERLMVSYAAFDNSADPRLVVNVVTQYATALVDQLTKVRGDSWPHIARAAARYAEFAGWLHQDAGDPVCAGQWTDTALSIAHASGDEGMVAYVLMRRSNQAAEQDQPGTALGLADAALNTAGARTPRIRALGYRQKAAGLALVGDLHGCMDAIARAREAIGSDPNWNPLTGYCTIHYLDAEAALCFLRLGLPNQAVELFASAIDAWPTGYVRDRAFYQAHFAEALTLVGSIDAAVDHVRQTGAFVATSGSGRTAVQVERIPTVLDEVDRHKVAADLRGELAALAV